MLTKKYMASVNHIPEIFDKIIQGTAPDKFTVSHLNGLGFTSSNDRGIIGLLKDLGFLSTDGTPTDRYHAYRDKSKSKAVMAEALREAYGDLFHINENPSENDRDAIIGKFKSAHNTTDRVAEQQARTFLTLLKLADLKAKPPGKMPTPPPEAEKLEQPAKKERQPEAPSALPPQAAQAFTGFRYNIEVHLPPTKDPEVYNAIFKALKEHLLDD